MKATASTLASSGTWRQTMTAASSSARSDPRAILGAACPPIFMSRPKRPGDAAGTLITEIQFDDDPRLTSEARRQSKQSGYVIVPVEKGAMREERVQVELKMR